MKDEQASFISRLSMSQSVRDVWRIWLVLALLTSLPYLVAAVRTPNGHVFTGVLTAYDDTFTYFAWMRQGADGHLLMCDPYTSEPQRCEFFLPLWSALGAVARVSQLPIPVVFHSARLLSGFLLLVAARTVSREVLKSRRKVRYAIWMYALAGGFGWLVYALNNGSNLLSAAYQSGSADLDLPEAIAFRSVFSLVRVY
jgi:hypothetical protein